ncbi:LytTR family DNA-binding domain-containing protein [Roseovarius pelagicus]|uniref:LytTR family transcriptional regulator n=1 Tax=Roseovarius pelagicus TaxID=2980108 RepID=A0ABY6DGQ5_9RHOB|nr:LytTR family DNA-binding domain-containing protein [Roseovarius pelagicus]UXX84705.1 LytTR family transcriptional regulator [Roseovarius pelagicus]
MTSPLTLFVWAAGWLIGSVAGPFGTFESMPIGVRTFFWLVIVTSAVLIGYTARAIAAIAVEYDRPWLFDLVAIGVTVLVFSPVVLIVGAGIETQYGAPVPSLPRIALYVLVIAGPIFALRRLIPGFERQRHSTVPKPKETPPQPRLMRRLPTELHGDLIRLSANGHFTEVTTSRGTMTLRLRLSDAIAETDPVRGHCTHRSHWVAEAAIQDVKRETPHKVVLVLANEETVPVSRKYRPELEAAGLIS